MFSLININTVARFESKMLFRSWFFRIFTLLSIIILGFVNFALVAKKSGMNWTFVALPSFIPYFVLMLFNMLQAVIAVFLASDFARRDKNLDTSKVIFTRPVSNTEYFLGKTIGILYVFLILNILIMAEALIFNLTSKLVSIDFISFLIYPLFISLPTLVFIIGLSYIFMTITRNQAITFILLIGYVALTSFYLGSKLNYMLDFMAYRVPLAQSDFIGFGNISEILVHRGMYIFYGLGLIFLSVRFMERLPQSNSINVTLIIALVFIVTGAALSIKYLSDFSTTGKLREKAIETNNKYVNSPIADIQNYELDIKHKGQSIEGKAKIKFINKNNSVLSKYIFSLNNGFDISKIVYHNKNAKYSRDFQIVEIIPEQALKPGETDSLTFFYSGKPDDRICYLDIDTTTWHEQFRMFLLNVDNRFGIVDDNFLLLTKEVNWYPVAGVGYSSLSRFRSNNDFAKYTINIKTKPRLTAITQGKLIKSGKGRFLYKTEIPIPQISLTIGNYEKLSVKVDSVEYALYRKKNHKYWTQHLSEIGDTIGPVLKDLIGDYQRKLGLSYQYNKCFIVEVPIQFSALPRFNTVSWDFSQPEMIFLPENGFMLFNADFRQMELGRRSRNNNKDQTEKEKQISKFKRAFNATLASGTAFIMSKARRGEISNYFSLFPLYYTHVYHINSDKWPIINLAVESYFNSRIKGQFGFFRFDDGISNTEKANVYLQRNSLEYYLENEKNKDKLNSIISAKGEYLFTALKYKSGLTNFNKTLNEFLDNSKFCNSEFNNLLKAINKNLVFDIDTILDTWYKSNKSALYAIDIGDYYKVIQDNKEVYQYIFRITNHADVEGFFTFNYDDEGGRRFSFIRGYGNENQDLYIYHLKPGETKEIGIQLSRQLRNYKINTIVSQNTPVIFTRWTDKKSFELKENRIALDGERIISEKVEFESKDEIIVDNLDNGFKLTAPKSNKFIKDLFEKKETEFDYETYNWRPKPKWQHYISSEAYGRGVYSAYCTKPGNGDFKASWTTSLPKNGKYDVYTFLIASLVRSHRHRDNCKDCKYIYTVHHDDGNEEVPLELENIGNGWIYLGEFYFSGDSATVELSNKGEPPMIIIADAIRWVKK